MSSDSRDPPPPGYAEKQPPSLDAMLSRDDSFSELLKQNQQHDTATNKKKVISPMTPKSPKSPREHRAMDERHTIEGAHENLGEDFESTPWLPPSVNKAQEFKKEAIYHGGTMRIDALNLTKAEDLGAGVILYFQFAMTMSITLFVMSLLSLPSLIIIYNGQGMAEEDRDAFGMYRYTLGNVGYENYNDESARCKSSQYAEDDNCIHFGGNEISVKEASNVFTAMEFISIVVFFCAVFHLQRRAFSVTGKTSKSQVSISDYAVQVHNIPSDCSDEQILKHFSDLYALDHIDWKGRPPMEGAEPVSDVANTEEPMHLDTWIAECVLHKGIGHFISSFKAKQNLMEKLYRSRARMKMYAENSMHAGGHKLNKYEKAEKQMLSTASKIDQLTEKTIKKKGLKLLNNDKINMKNIKSIYRNIDAPAVSAFIVFNYQESKVRCLEDYEKYSKFPHYLNYPTKLLFRGKRLIVTPAVEPDQIVWENLEKSYWSRVYLRLRTFFIVILLVLICFFVILQASIFKTEFQSNIPDKDLCNEIIPQLYTNNSNLINYNKLIYDRPDNNIKLDKQCSNLIKDTFYLEYKNNDGDEDIIYDINACIDEQSMCPSSGQSAFCPCVSTTSIKSCESIECSITDDNTEYDIDNCQKFEIGDIGKCYCYNSLTNIISTNGPVETMDRIEQNREEEVCQEFFQEYSLSVGLTYLSVITTAGVNFLLRKVLVVLSKQEGHTTTDSEQGSIMSKVFLSNYITMAIIVLIVYGTSDNNPQLFRTLRIFEGPYLDFNRPWYGNIGFYLMTTFILQSFSPLFSKLFFYYIGKPFMRFWNHKRVKEFKSTNIVMQNDLNMMEVGPVFDSTIHTAQLLTVLFFAMTYAPGLPLLMPLCCFTFVMYFRIDKVLLCRFYQKPPHIGNAAIKIVIGFLPYAAMLRLAFGIWMFSNYRILPDDGSGNSALANFLRGARNSGTGTAADKYIFRENVFPLFCLLLIIIIIKLIRKIWKMLPIYWILKCFKMIYHCLANDNDLTSKVNETGSVHAWDLMKMNDSRRQQAAPFTGQYFRYIKHKDEIPNTCFEMFQYQFLTKMDESELDEGWELRDVGDFVIKVKLWRDNNKKLGHKRGDIKKTYEVVGDHRASTYNVEKVPAYRIAMQGLREGTASMLELQNKQQLDKNIVDTLLYDAFDAGNMESNVVENYNKRKERRKSMENEYGKDIEMAAMSAMNDVDSRPGTGADRIKPHQRPQSRDNNSGAVFVGAGTFDRPASPDKHSRNSPDSKGTHNKNTDNTDNNPVGRYPHKHKNIFFNDNNDINNDIKHQKHSDHSHNHHKHKKKHDPPPPTNPAPPPLPKDESFFDEGGLVPDNGYDYSGYAGGSYDEENYYQQGEEENFNEGVSGLV